jgi:hypothetical protein
VVAERPSSSPVRASANTPEQIVTSRAPRAYARSSARRTRADSGASTGSQPGMITVFADSIADRSCDTDIAYPLEVGTEPGVSVHTTNS